ncbi:MAG: hypothetical protein HY579_00480 [Nitrospinae bacterium]|nr:hypothetical protein [Nitrospinota bacterium]
MHVKNNDPGDPETFLQSIDWETERTPKEFVELAEQTHKSLKPLAHTEIGWKRYLSKNGFYKKFWEEIYPLHFFARHYFTGKTDIRLRPVFGKQNYDALVTDYSTSPPTVTKLEFTQAVDGYEEQLRHEHLREHGSVNAWGKVTVTGTKNTGHQIEVEDECFSVDEKVEEQLLRIKDAALNKSGKPYGKDTWLIIFFSNWTYFMTDEWGEITKLRDFVRRKVLPLKLDFGKLFVLGFYGEPRKLAPDTFGLNPTGKILF